jgi:hypothetical protein
MSPLEVISSIKSSAAANKVSLLEGLNTPNLLLQLPPPGTSCSLDRITAHLPSTNPTISPTISPTLSIKLMCPYYSTSNTNNAIMNYDTCDFYACPGTKLTISGCDSNGRCQSDQYLRLFDASNNQITSNDDYCSVCSQITYTLKQPCQIYSIHEGCYSTSSCSGTISISSSSTSLILKSTRIRSRLRT